MSDRAAALAAQFEDANAAVIAAVERCSPEQWAKTCSAEGWSVGVTAHHIATGHAMISSFVGMVANGQPVPPVTREMIDAGNAQHAQEHAGCTREEVLEMLRRDGSAAAGLLRGLSDEQLDRTAPMAFAGGAELSAQAIAEMILIGHPKDHVRSIQAVLAG